MLNLPESILLGIVQGITEWLPVSSSGHLVLAQKFIGIDVPVAFDIWLHLATLLVIFLFFWQDIKKISNAALKWQTKTAEFKTAIYMITATIATAIVVFPFKNLFERAFSNLPAVAFGFLATGMLLLLSGRRQGNKKINSQSAILIGIAQGLAFLPGISRSGSTISTALLLKTKKLEAFKFSFLIALPAILGAFVLKIPELAGSGIPAATMAAGFIAAFLASLVSLAALRRILLKNKLHYFAYYCLIIAALTLITHFSKI
ncbi:undecaprenyl-diphosphate phosphatase [Candidatus Pacearchaeota archaeon]|nr:undecaprenyl-diphosphate phosphatase [Candidatus Pacearchaeota archaeon]